MPTGRTPAARPARRGYKEVAAVQRALDVLEALAQLPADEGEIGVSDLSKQIRLSKSTVARLLANLEARGYVAQNPTTERYHLAWKMVDIFRAKVRLLGVSELARPLMQRLLERTGHTVNLGVPHREQVVLIEVLEPAARIRVSGPVGVCEPLHCTALGKAVLAALDPAEAERLLRAAGTPARTARTLDTVEKVLADVGRVRERGYAIDDREIDAICRCVGAVVRDHTGRPVGALSVSALAEQMPMARAREIGETVAAAAAELSARLGYAAPAADDRPRTPVGAASAGR